VITIARPDPEALDDIQVHIQARCGCCGDTPCYWSTQPWTRGEDLHEYAEFAQEEKGCVEEADPNMIMESGSPPTCKFSTLVSAANNVVMQIINAFQFSAYQACFQPYRPIYAPQSIQVSFWVVPASYFPKPTEGFSDILRRDLGTGTILEEAGAHCYFRSEKFGAEHTRDEQSFPIPSVILLPNTIVRVDVFGAHQRQTITDPSVATGTDYFVCIDEMKLLGFRADGFFCAIDGGPLYETEERREYEDLWGWGKGTSPTVDGESWDAAPYSPPCIRIGRMETNVYTSAGTGKQSLIPVPIRGPIQYV
jgi:hypothetical protein